MLTAEDAGREMAVLHVGDWWTYEMEGSVEREGRTMALHGTVQVTIVRMGERLAISFTPDHRIVGVDGPEGVFPMPAGRFWFEQDPATRDVLIAGDNMGPGGSDRFALKPQVFYPGRFGPDTAYDNVLDFAPHGRVANRLQVTGIESVETPAGTFAAWKAPIASVSEQFGTVEGCDWWRPALGAPVRFDMTAAGPDGSRLSTSSRLKATNRALA